MTDILKELVEKRVGNHGFRFDWKTQTGSVGNRRHR